MRIVTTKPAAINPQVTIVRVGATHMGAAQMAKAKGAALILALLIVAIVSTLAVQFAFTFKLNVTRVENRWHGEQAQHYLLGAENLAKVFLKRDLEETDIDELAEEWAMDIPPLETDHGWLQAKIEDAQSKINLNNLQEVIVPEEGVTLQPWQRFTEPQKRFIRLLQCFEDEPVTEDEAIEITEAVIDWIDQDDEPMGYGGAESSFYSRAEPPYEPANRLFSSVSELRLIRNMTPELYGWIEPWLVALPEPTNLNINTAPIMILRTINDGDVLQPMPEQDLSTLIEDRELQAYESINDFFENPVVDNVFLNPVKNNAKLGVETEFFTLYGKATVGEQERLSISSIVRKQDSMRVYQRRYTTY